MAHALRLGDLLRQLCQGIQIPRPCLVCQQRAWRYGVCALCIEELALSRQTGERCRCCALRLSPQGWCRDCSSQPLAVEQVFVAWDYENAAEVLIQAFKRGHQHWLVRVMAEVLCQQIVEQWPQRPAQFQVVSIPASKAALIKRGFNPAAEIAKRVAQQLHQPYAYHVLQRVEPRGGATAQKQRSRQQRLATDGGTWHCASQVANSTLLVVDDVLTTGSTLHHAAQACKRAGVQHVYAAVVARTPWRDFF